MSTKDQKKTTTRKKRRAIDEIIETSFDITPYVNAYNEYIGWSIYTGYATKTKSDSPLSKDLNYLGEWTGINQNSSPAEIKKDIDARIDVLMKAFEVAVQHYQTGNPLIEEIYPNRKDVIKAFSNKYFVVPEFFFRCKEGPYPDVKIEKAVKSNDWYQSIEYNYYEPLEYIKEEIEEKFKKIIENHFQKYQTFHTYYLVIGSVMTSNVENYDDFFNEEVEQRTTKFREMYEKKDLGVTAKTFYDDERIKRFNPKNVRKDYRDFFDKILADERTYPLCIVRNRGLVFLGHPATALYSTYRYEKQRQSSIDLPLGTLNENGILTNGRMITEWMAAYPSYSITHGDKITHPDQSFARFSPFGTSIDFDNFIKEKFLEPYKIKQDAYDLIKQVFIARNRNFDTGIELGLDHLEKRLRRTVGMTSEAGADADNYPLSTQIIPSTNTRLNPNGLAIEQGGAAFNVDGAIALLDEQHKKRVLNALKKKKSNSNFDVDNWENYSNDLFIKNGLSYRKKFDEVYSRYMNSEWKDKDGKYYYSHTQLAFALPDAYMAGYNVALGNNNERARTYRTKIRKQQQIHYNYLLDAFDSKNITLKGLEHDENLYVAGIGELHHYFPIKENYPIKRVAGFGSSLNIVSTPNKDEGGIKEIKLYYKPSVSLLAEEGGLTNRAVRVSNIYERTESDLNSYLITNDTPIELYHGDGYTQHQLNRRAMIFCGMEVTYKSGFIQKMEATTNSKLNFTPKHITIRLSDEMYINGIRVNLSDSRDVEGIDFRIFNQNTTEEKWTNIFTDWEDEYNQFDKFRILEDDNKMPLERISYRQGNQKIIPELDELYIGRLEFLFGKQTYTTMPLTVSLFDTSTPPTFVPTPKSRITKIGFYRNSLGVQYGKSIGEMNIADAITFGEDERLVGIAALVYYDSYNNGAGRFQELRFRIKNIATNEEYWSDVVFFPSHSIRTEPRIIHETHASLDSHRPDDSLEFYREQAIKRYHINDEIDSFQNYSFQYAYGEGHTIWKITPHVQQGYIETFTGLYFDEYLAGLTIKFGYPF